jgi:hypothetical protein
MTSPYTLTVTDDEAAAFALQANGAWRTPLPTVNEASDTDLGKAIVRGRRSLVVRDLAKPDGTAVGAAAEVLTRLGGGPRAAFLLVDAGGKWVPAGLTVYLYGPRHDDIQMSHVVAAAGVHSFKVAPPPRQWPALTELAEAVFRDGFAIAGGGAQQPVAALLVQFREDGTRTVRVAHRSATADDGAGSRTFTSVAQAVAWLAG